MLRAGPGNPVVELVQLSYLSNNDELYIFLYKRNFKEKFQLRRLHINRKGSAFPILSALLIAYFN